MRSATRVSSPSRRRAVEHAVVEAQRQVGFHDRHKLAFGFSSSSARGGPAAQTEHKRPVPAAESVWQTSNRKFRSS